MKLSTRNIGLIGLFVAATIATNLIFYYIFFFVYLTIIHILPKKEAVLYSFIYALINFLSGISIYPAINVVLLPLTTLLLFRIKDMVYRGDNIRSEQLTFCLYAAGVILVNNLLYQVVFSLVTLSSLSTALVALNMPYILFTVIVNPVLFFMIGYPIVQRVQVQS